MTAGRVELLELERAKCQEPPRLTLSPNRGACDMTPAPIDGPKPSRCLPQRTLELDELAAAAGATEPRDELGALELELNLPDSALYTPAGRRLLVALGVVEPDPLRVAAELWLLERSGPRTKAAAKVRATLGAAWPEELLEAGRRFRGVK